MDPNILFNITLEDYSFPRYASEVQDYFGTIEDITTLIKHLSGNKWTACRYAETINAIQQYPSTQDMYHTVAGQCFLALAPMKELCRLEFDSENPHWTYTGFHKTKYPMCAEVAKICRLLLEDYTGLYRCIKVSFTNLMLCLPNSGWQRFTSDSCGFPGLAVRSPDGYAMTLYSSEKWYLNEDREQAIADTLDISTIDWTVACKDILGEV